MAKRDKFASIDTYFVLDPYIQTLNANDRWLYFVLICNPDISMIGTYEIGLPTLELYSGLGREAIGHAIDRFAKAGKIHYVDGWVIVKNHIKNNPVSGKAAGVIIGAHKRFTDLPWTIKDRLIDPKDSLYIPYLDPTHELYIGYTEDMHNRAVAYGSLSQSRAQARALGQNTKPEKNSLGGNFSGETQKTKKKYPDDPEIAKAREYWQSPEGQAILRGDEQ